MPLNRSMPLNLLAAHAIRLSLYLAYCSSLLDYLKTTAAGELNARRRILG